MRFLHDGKQSKIYVIFICGTLVFRTVSAVLFGYALWVMYKSMRLYYRNSGTSKGANPASFYSHMLVMVLYLVGRTCSTYAYGKAAWENDLPEVLWLVSNCIAWAAYMTCYLLILYICFRMHRDYTLIRRKQIDKMKEKQEIAA